MDGLPTNVHVSRHPCLQAKLSQLRSKNTTTRETEQLIHDIAIILGTEALAGLELVESGTVSLSIQFLRTTATQTNIYFQSTSKP